MQSRLKKKLIFITAQFSEAAVVWRLERQILSTFEMNLLICRHHCSQILHDVKRSSFFYTYQVLFSPNIKEKLIKHMPYKSLCPRRSKEFMSVTIETKRLPGNNCILWSVSCFFFVNFIRCYLSKTCWQFTVSDGGTSMVCAKCVGPRKTRFSAVTERWVYVGTEKTNPLLV